MARNELGSISLPVEAGRREKCRRMVGVRTPVTAGVALLAGLMVAVGCGPAEQVVQPKPAPEPAAQSQPGVPSQPTSSPAAVKRGGTISFMLGTGAVSTMNDPHKAASTVRPWGPISNSPLKINPESMQVESAVLKSWDISPNGLVYTFQVRDNVYFHDIPPVNGRQMIAQDVAYTLTRATGKYNPEDPYALWPRFSALANMDRAEATDKFSLKVTLTKPNVGLLAGMTDNRLVIVAKEAVDAFGDLRVAKRETMVGTGPFFIDSYSDERGGVYKANPKYWKQGVDGKPLPYFSEMRGILLRDKATTMAAFISRQIDYIEWMMSRDVAQIRRSVPDLQEIKRGGTQGLALYYNLQRSPWTDIRVRRAIDLVLDREMMGNGHAGTGYWVHAAPVSGLHYPFWALPQQELAALPGRKSGDSRKADIEQAKQLLKEAGITQLDIPVSGIGTAGDPNGYLEYPVMIVENLNRDLKDAGITAKFVAFGADQIKNVTERRYDVNWFGPAYSVDPGLWLHEQYHSEGARNYSGFSDPKFDALWEKQQAEHDPDKRKALMVEAQRYVLEQVPRSLTVDIPMLSALQSYLKGVVPYMGGMLGAPVTTNIESAWLDK